MRLNQDKIYKLPLTLSILFHILLFLMLFLHFSSSSTSYQLAKPQSVNIINAVAVNQDQIQEKLTRKQVVVPQPTPTPAPAMQATDNQAAKLKLAQQQLVKQQAQALALKKQQLLTQLQKQKIAEQRAKLAAQKAAEQTKLKRQQAALAAKRKAEEKQKQLMAKFQAAQQSELEQQIANEQEQLAASSAQQAQNEIQKYAAIIQQAIEQNWIVPPDVSKNLSCVLIIQTAPGGRVLSVQIARSSGNPGLDNSAVSAVYKTSPLPVPKDPELFDNFRKFQLTVNPAKLTPVGG